MPVAAGSRVCGDQIVSGRRRFGQDLIGGTARVIRATRVFRSAVGRRDVGYVLCCCERHLRRATELLRDADPEIPFILNIPAHNRHVIELSAGPCGDRRDGNGRAVNHRASHIGSVGVRGALQLQDLRRGERTQACGGGGVRARTAGGRRRTGLQA